MWSMARSTNSGDRPLQQRAVNESRNLSREKAIAVLLHYLWQLQVGCFIGGKLLLARRTLAATPNAVASSFTRESMTCVSSAPQKGHFMED